MNNVLSKFDSLEVGQKVKKTTKFMSGLTGKILAKRRVDMQLFVHWMYDRNQNRISVKEWRSVNDVEPLPFKL